MVSLQIPQGFSLSVTAAGFRRPGRTDLGLVLSSTPAVTAGVFTTNLFKAAPVLVGQEVIAASTTARAVLINTGQANACTGPEGMANCREAMGMVADKVGISPSEILPASTGVIGAQLKMDNWRKAVPSLVDGLGKASLEDFATAIMTTDAFPKFAAEEITLSGGVVTIAGVAKGAGMICPNMATMLSLVMCDAGIEPSVWRAMFSRAVERTFNRATVDGDTSTNDTLYGLANGASGVTATSSEDCFLLEEALVHILDILAYKLVQDGEGATKVLHIRVVGATSSDDAEKAARTVGHSPLVKTAMYGKDANWGRIVAALGRSGAVFDPKEVSISLCGVELFIDEQPTDLDFDTLLQEPLLAQDIYIDIRLGNGPGEYALMASDLTHEYVSINADYRS